MLGFFGLAILKIETRWDCRSHRITGVSRHPASSTIAECQLPWFCGKRDNRSIRVIDTTDGKWCCFCQSNFREIAITYFPRHLNFIWLLAARLLQRLFKILSSTLADHQTPALFQ
jgi:hypothetical protein